MQYIKLWMHLFKLVRFVKVRDLPTGENVVDVFKEGLLHHLCVCEEEYGGFVLHPRLVVELADICMYAYVCTYMHWVTLTSRPA